MNVSLQWIRPPSLLSQGQRSYHHLSSLELIPSFSSFLPRTFPVSGVIVVSHINFVHFGFGLHAVVDKSKWNTAGFSQVSFRKQHICIEILKLGYFKDAVSISDTFRHHDMTWLKTRGKKKVSNTSYLILKKKGTYCMGRTHIGLPSICMCQGRGQGRRQAQPPLHTGCGCCICMGERQIC